MTSPSRSRPDVRVGVIGTGVMGQHHLRVYDQLKNAVLTGCYDTDHEKREQLARQYGCKPFATLEEMMEEVDAVSICSPSSLHKECGLAFLEKKIHCLIEKPLATSPEDCSELIACAKRVGVKLLVGHIERFNPAVQQVFSLLAEGAKIQSIDACRMSSVSARIKDVDVVADLMVHDLDIVLALAGSPVASVNAAEVLTEKYSNGDHVIAMLQFESGVIASLTASRISQKPARQLVVTTDRGVVEIDYMNQSAEIYLQTTMIRKDSKTSPFGEYVSGISLESVQIRRLEPLQLELAHFIDIIQNDKDPMVSGDQALSAMKLVWNIQDILGSKRRDG